MSSAGNYIFYPWYDYAPRMVRIGKIQKLSYKEHIKKHEFCQRERFVILYEKYSRLMMKVALNILRDRFLAEDAVQDAFVHIARNMEKIGYVESLETKNYLVVAVKNASIDIYRKRSVRMKREIFVDELGEADEPVSYMETDADNSVLEVLTNLPVMYRNVFLLKYSSRLENKEIARMLINDWKNLIPITAKMEAV